MKSYDFKKKKGNLILFIAVLLIAGGYVFFLSSTTWLPANLSAKLKTALRQDIKWAERTIQITRWDYCSASEVMEVELDIKNLTYDGINTYKYRAASRSESFLEVEPVVEESDWVVLRINGVEDDFGEISLRISADIPETEPLKVYTNVNVVNRVESLDKLDVTGYQNKRLEVEIQNYIAENQRLEDEIAEMQEINERMKSEIQNLNGKTGYLTETQKQEIYSQIKNIETRIESNNDDIQSNLKAINENSERIELLKKQLAK